MAHFFVAADALRLIAVYSPKCASQTLRAWCTGAIEAATREPVPDLDLYLVGPNWMHRYEDYWKALFVRDPLRRLVSFYLRWVVHDQARWCFADAQRRISLRDKTFRQFLFALRHLHEHGLELQHHLVPQVAKLDGWRFDEIVPVERLAHGLEGLNRRLQISVPVPRFNLQRYELALREPAPDRTPDWLRRNGCPVPELFYDDEALGLAAEIYARDIEFYRENTDLQVLRGAR